MKKTLSIILAFCMVIAASTIANATKAELVNPYVDVASDAWYHDEVVKAVDTGIINGKTATEFKPDDSLTYAEAVKLAACMNQVYLNGEVTLANGEPWYKPYADYCKENKITEKEYDYNKNATRAGYMEIFANALPDEAFEEINNVPDGSILDVKDNAPYAIYVYKLYRAGIVAGVDAKHNCKPDESIKRCEGATIISRMMDDGERVEFDMGGSLSNKGTSDDDITINKIPATENKNEPVDEPEDEPKDDPIIKDVDIKTEHESIVVEIPTTFEKQKFDATESPTLSILTIHKQPEGSEAEEYGSKYELEVQVFGGKAPYTYEWQYKIRRDAVTIKNGDYVNDADTATMILSVEKENALLGEAIYCKITDADGTVVTSDSVKVYGPFSMPVDESLSDSGKYTLVGRVADGILKKGEKISVIRNDKVIAIGVADDLQMFNKSMDETVKGDNVGIVFNREDGVRPFSGDIVVKYQPSHVIDTSDIVN